jgi:hypothetical protein
MSIRGSFNMELRKAGKYRESGEDLFGTGSDSLTLRKAGNRRKGSRKAAKPQSRR